MEKKNWEQILFSPTNWCKLQQRHNDFNHFFKPLIRSESGTLNNKLQNLCWVLHTLSSKDLSSTKYGYKQHWRKWPKLHSIYTMSLKCTSFKARI